MTNPRAKSKNHKILLTVKIIAGIIIVPLVVYVAFLLIETGNLYYFGEPFWYEGGRLHFGPSSCKGENQKLQCSVTADPYSWCSCTTRTFDKDGREIFEALKPILYFYPETETEVSVKLGLPENLTVSYPKYTDIWTVLAKPNGDLTEIKTGKNLYSLYYESKNSIIFKVEKDGFIVKGEDSAKFLEEKLSLLGLTEREAEEFIIYWLPKLENNNYNYIRFASEEEINKNIPLEISPKPNNLIRVLMIFKGLKTPEAETLSKNLIEQSLKTPSRSGFTIVEWGGSEIE